MAIESVLRVRRAHVGDLESIVSFSLEMAQETEGRRLDRSRLRQGTGSLLNTPEHGFFMVVEQPETSQIIGQLMITYEWSDWRNAVFWWIQSVYVTPAWRRQGVFRRLHATVLAEAKKDPRVCGVRLYVDATNRIAQDVYKRVGLSPSSYAVFETDFVLGRHQQLEDRPDEA
ncbi:MAG: GNAT family N-acetyltransferase [Nitrospira sp.]